MCDLCKIRDSDHLRGTKRTGVSCKVGSSNSLSLLPHDSLDGASRATGAEKGGVDGLFLIATTEEESCDNDERESCDPADNDAGDATLSEGGLGADVGLLDDEGREERIRGV